MHDDSFDVDQLESELAEQGSSLAKTDQINNESIRASRIERIVSGKSKVDTFSTLPQNTRADKIRLYNATSAQGNALQSLATGTVIDVTDATVTYAQFEQQDGSRQDGVKLVLTDTNGNNHVILSQTFIKEFGKIMLMFGMETFDPPLRVSAVEHRINGGRKYYLPKIEA